MFCHKCGSKISEDATFCHKCGTKVEKVEAEHQEFTTLKQTNSVLECKAKTGTSITKFAKFGLAAIILLVLIMSGALKNVFDVLVDFNRDIENQATGSYAVPGMQSAADLFPSTSYQADEPTANLTESSFGIRYDDKGISLINFSEETGKMIHMNFYSENCTFNGKKFVDTTTEKAMKNISTPEGTQITPSNIIEYSLYSKINQVTDPKYKFFRVIEKDHTIEYITYEDYVIYMFLYSNQLDRFVGDESASLGSEADSADAYSGELLYRGEAIANLLGSTPEELNKVFCAPTGGDACNRGDAIWWN